jgi:hypothetical protein
MVRWIEREGAEYVIGAALRQLVAPHGWDIPVGRVDMPANPVLRLEGAGRGGGA